MGRKELVVIALLTPQLVASAPPHSSQPRLQTTRQTLPTSSPRTTHIHVYSNTTT